MALLDFYIFVCLTTVRLPSNKIQNYCLCLHSALNQRPSTCTHSWIAHARHLDTEHLDTEHNFIQSDRMTRSVPTQMSLILRTPAFCICENKDADQLRGDREADQRLCFRYTDSTIPLLPKSEISSL